MHNYRDIDPLNETNLGGGNYILFIDVADVASMPRPVDNNISSPISLKPNKGFWKADFSKNTLRMNTKPVDAGGSSAQEIEMVGVVAKSRPAMVQLFSTLNIRRCLVIYVDNNGLSRIIGSLDAPALFSYEEDTANKFTSRNESLVRFTWRSKDPAPFYQADLPEPVKSQAEFFLVFNVDSINGQDINVTENEEGYYKTESLTNVASVTYKVNGSTKTLPFYLSIGDTFNISITRNNNSNKSIIQLSGNFS